MLARRRAEAVKAYLVSKGVSADKVKIVAIQEDWSGLKDAVKDNWFGEEKQDILRIIDDQTMDNDRRESELRKLSHGQVWNKLITSWMQDLRRVNVRLE